MKSLKRTITGFPLIVIVLLMSAIGDAQETPKHPIDKALDACLDKDSTTAGMTNCIGKAYEKWDKELNRIYAELMKKLSPEGKANLKDAQLQWLKFRDSEFKLQDSVYSTLEGTMYIPMRASDRMEVVKKRAVELKSHLELLKEAQ
jgi:uncharacterized protein YecT (DUF1311 family)